MKKDYFEIILGLIAFVLFSITFFKNVFLFKPQIETKPVELQSVEISPVEEEEEIYFFEEEDYEIPVIHLNNYYHLTFEEQELLQQIAMAEARGEDAIGQALVMRAVINRYEMNNSSIREEIFKDGQFYVIGFGHYVPNDENNKALAMVLDGWNETMLETEEEWDRTKKVFYFGADGYPVYGEHAFRYGGHWFSVR